MQGLLAKKKLHAGIKLIDKSFELYWNSTYEKEPKPEKVTLFSVFDRKITRNEPWKWIRDLGPWRK